MVTPLRDYKRAVVNYIARKIFTCISINGYSLLDVTSRLLHKFSDVKNNARKSGLSDTEFNAKVTYKMQVKQTLTNTELINRRNFMRNNVINTIKEFRIVKIVILFLGANSHNVHEFFFFKPYKMVF